MHVNLVEQLTDVALRRSLRSTLCPACSGAKIPSKKFCGTCFYSLTPSQRKNLYRPLVDGYLQAVDAAMRQLGKTEFILPKEQPQSQTPNQEKP